jgi:peptide/nickel transport system permease protein
MALFALRRLGSTLLTLLASSFLVFGGNRPLTPEQVSALEARYHLDDPFLVRYFRWIGDMARGDWGVSIVQNDSVANLIGERLGTTLVLVGYATVVLLAIGLAVGLLAAISGPRVQAAVTALTTIALATPPFFYALIFVAIFAVGLGWFPVFGVGEGLLENIWHLTLPAFALALSGCALISRIVRNSVSEELGKEYAEVARARGLRERRVLGRHVLRNALVPTVTIAGLTVAALFADTAVIETAFGINGIGQLLVSSVLAKDFAVVQAITLLIVFIFLCTNLIVDLLYRVLDPRMSQAVTA